MLKAKDLNFTNDADQAVLEGISFDLAKGEVMLVRGANGSGKTTLLKCLAGLLALDNGKINIKDFLFISHKASFNKSLTVLENLLYCCRLSQLTPVDLSTFDIRVTRALAQFGMADKGHTKAEELSAGQQKKVALSCLFLQSKPVWLLDEPTTNLDKPSQAILKERIVLHLKWGGVAVIATHQNDFFEGCNHVSASTLYL